jgi:hypothetical protein
LGRFFGNCPDAALIAAWMSLAAASMLRSRSNWTVTAGRAERTRRGHLRHAGDLRDLPLERLGDRGRHRVGRRAGQAGADRNGGEVDLRQRRDRQQRIGDDACEQDRHHDQSGGDRMADERAGDAFPDRLVCRH